MKMTSRLALGMIAVSLQRTQSLALARSIHRMPPTAMLRGGSGSRSRDGGGARMMSASASPLAEKITAHIESADVVVFSKSWCPFCMQTKGLFETLQVPVTYIELDELADGADMQAELAQMSGQRTVPNVFIKGTHLGGNDDTQRAARSGKLQELLATSKL